MRTELLDGEVVEMAPIGWGHASIVARMVDALSELCGAQAWIWPQGPIQLNDFSLPQPDVTVLVRRPDAYADGGPKPADVLLLVEVADSSLQFDRSKKLGLYAAAGVSVVWIVDVKARHILVYSGPSISGYALHLVVTREEQVWVPCAEREVPVERLIG
jgi:Uma2 family endonuclease